MFKRSPILLIITGLSLFLVGCGGNQVEVTKTSPTVQPLYSEYLDVRNCDSTKALDKTLSDFLTVQEEVTVSEQATAVSSGKTSPISGAICKDLRDKVETAYHQEYQEAQNSVQEIAINVPADKIHMYKVQWNKKTFSGSLSFQLEDELYETSYTYKLEVPQLDGSFTMSCTA
ncbi:MAG: hypothetical protein U5K99_01735 [Anaerolineales bacterium]|nr:hypothetical protein [Anaerolineales bacterium]